jgi:predicted Ser/Thr protein kinase
LAIQADREFHNNEKFLEMLKNYYLDIFDEELRSSLGLVDNRSYEDYIKKYMEHIKSLIKGEKVKNTITGKFEDVDMFFIKEFEQSLKLNEDAEKFRSQLISRLGAYALDNPKKEIVYVDIFSDISRKLQETFRDEQKRIIDEISKNMVFFEAELNSDGKEQQLSDKYRKLISSIIEQLKDKYSYSTNGAIRLIKYLINERY